MEKICIILRGCPGAGKSALAESLIANSKSGFICCADDYFMHNGEYLFDKDKLYKAHQWCFNNFEQQLKNQADVIVVANTNTRLSDVKPYRELALEYNYKVFVMIVENWHDGENIHMVDQETIDIMKNRIKQNIKL